MVAQLVIVDCGHTMCKLSLVLAFGCYKLDGCFDQLVDVLEALLLRGEWVCFKSSDVKNAHACKEQGRCPSEELLDCVRLVRLFDYKCIGFFQFGPSIRVIYTSDSIP